VVHVLAHGSSIDEIIASISRGEALDGMVLCDGAEIALEEIRRNVA
jgi:hypothetical protein